MRRLLPVLLLPLLLAGCPKRHSGDIDVDAVQERVDTIDGLLSQAGRQVESKNIAQAREHLEEAEEIMEDEADLLAAYPELGELRQRLEQTRRQLCAGSVEVSLGEFYRLLRQKLVERAQEQIEEVNRCYRQCRQVIEGNSEYLALKMGVEGAPGELERLRRRLAAEADKKRVDEAGGRLQQALQRLEASLVELEKSPNQPERARRIKSALAGWQAELKESAGQLDKLPGWPAWRKRLAARQAGLQARLEKAVRRGKLLALATGILPRAARTSLQAATTRDLQQSRKLVQQAYDDYRKCLEVVQRFLAVEPSLARFRVPWRSTRRSVSWLRNHCRANLRITSRMLRKLGVKIKALPARPAPEKKKPTTSTIPAKKKKKNKKRRGRIRRW